MRLETPLIFREVEKEKVFAITSFSKDILDLFDNLERAMHECSEQEKQGSFYQGVQMSYNAGLGTLKRFNIT